MELPPLIVLLLLLVASVHVHGLSSSPQPKQVGTSPYYTYKTMKRMEVPSMVFSTAANLASRLMRLKPKELSCDGAINDGERRIAIVTGSNTGVGYETANSLVNDHGFEVVIACRSSEKGRQTCEAINEKGSDTPSGKGKAVFVEPLNLVDFDSVRSFGKTMNEKYSTIHVLVNNAGVNSKGVTSTAEEGALDVVFSSNFLGHFLLTNLLLGKCRRVVNLGSVMHHFPNYSEKSVHCDVGTVEFWRDKAIATPPQLGTKRKTYGPSKLAAILFTLEIQRRYGHEVRSIAVNPGAVYSDIWRGYSTTQQRLFRMLYLTPKQGCRTSVAASVLDVGRDVVYLQPYRLPPRKKAPYPMFEMLGPFVGFAATPPRLPEDGGAEASNCLFQVCEELTACKFPQGTVAR